MVSLTQVLRMTLKDTYRNIVLLLTLNLIYLLLLSPAIFLIPLPLSVLYLAGVTGPMLMALAWSVQRMVYGEQTGVRQFWQAFGSYAGKGICFSLFLALFLFILVSSWWYWAETGRYFTFTLAIFQTYFVLMIMSSQLYTIPLHVKYGYSLRKCMLYSLNLLLKHPLYTLGAMLQLVSLALLLALTVVGFFLLYPALSSVFIHHTTANVNKDEMLAPPEQTGKDLAS